MDPQAQIQSLTDHIAQMEATNAELLQLLGNRGNNMDDETKFYKRISAHKPKTYDGEADPVKFEDWIFYMEKLLDVVSCPPNLRVKLASFYLEGPAELWWRNLKRVATDAREVDNHPNNLTWEAFLIKLKERFTLSLSRDRKSLNFYT